jgi:hypothetical protein
MDFPGNFLFEEKKVSRTLQRKAYRKAFFWHFVPQKCLSNRSFFRGGPEGVVFAKNTPSGKF